MKLFGRTLRLGDPITSDIVIFDEGNNHFIQRILKKEYTLFIFNQRPEDIWIGIRVAFQFFRCLGRIKIIESLEHNRGLIIGLLKQIRLLYFESCLMVINPKAVVTFIDNNASFFWLSLNCRRFPFIGIQNGNRLSYEKANNSGYYLQHLFCFGEHEKILFPTIGYHAEKFYPVGSLLASLHLDNSFSGKDEKYDILVVSTWRGNIGFQQDVKDMMNSMRIMDMVLARYIRSRVIKAAVILRAERNGEHWFIPEIGMSEEKYYQEIYGDCIEIIETNFSTRNIYPFMQQSRVIISCLSTAPLEAYGIGKKILYCNFTGTDLYHRDLDPKIVTKQSGWDEFSVLLDNLLSQPIEDYQRFHRETMRFYMAYPSGSSTQNVIVNSIDEIIKNHHVSVNK